MSRRTYTERADALALYVAHGLAEAARQSAVPRGTLSCWAVRAGLQTEAAAVAAQREQTEAARARWGEVTHKRREELAARLLAEVHKLLDQVQKATTYYRVVTLSGGQGAGASAAVVPVDLPHPLAKDQQARVAAVAALVEKLQLLTDHATERHHLSDFDMEAELQAHTSIRPGPSAEAATRRSSRS